MAPSNLTLGNLDRLKSIIFERLKSRDEAQFIIRLNSGCRGKVSQGHFDFVC